MKICIIDPSSTEMNRGSFCYSPYLLYNGLASRHVHAQIELFEAFKPEDIDKLPLDADYYVVTLWSYPQIETSLLLAQMLPYSTGKDNVYFSGYTPFAKELGVKTLENLFSYDPLQDQDFLRIAMSEYPNNYHKFTRLLLSDCDMHLKSKEQGKLVHPLFTSFGCQVGCSFCPSTVNCGKQRVALTEDCVLSMIHQCLKQDIRYIHFTDEDFFFNTVRAYNILHWMRDKGFHTIALGSAHAVTRFLDKYGMQPIVDAGLEIIEIGFETADATVCADMGGAKDVSVCYDLGKLAKKERGLNIFWLVQTFFPGETIHSLNLTGTFMQEFGFDMDEVVGRLRTNGTKGGLGQFFQPYVGLPIYKDLQANGMFLTERPIRLIPSYLPNSFLDSEIKKVDRTKVEAAKPWLALYNVPHYNCGSVYEGQKLRAHIESTKVYNKIQNAIALAIFARFGVIE